MKWFLLFCFLALPASAQSVSVGTSSLPSGGSVAAQKNVTLVYNTTTGQPDMVIIDANNLADPSWNPPGTKQIIIPLATYNTMPDAVTFQGYIASAITADIAAQAVNATVP